MCAMWTLLCVGVGGACVLVCIYPTLLLWLLIRYQLFSLGEYTRYTDTVGL